MDRTHSSSLAIAIAALLTAAAAQAEIDYTVQAGVGHSDNIARVPANETDETIGTLGLNLQWHEQTRRLDADATADLSYFEYLDNTFDSEVVGIADANLVVGIVPERFTWLFQDSFGQAQSDPFSPSTPETRENINYFTTGPNLILNFGTVARLTLFGRYSATQYEESPLDSERQSAGLVLARDLSSASEISLNAVSEKIEFDNAANTDFDRNGAFASYRLNGSRTNLQTDLGYTWIEPEVGDDTGGMFVNVSLERELTRSSTLRVELGQQFTDAGESLRGQITGGAPGGADVTATSDPFENRHVAVEWQFSRNRTGLSLGASWNEDEYETQTLLDRTRWVYSAEFSRRLARSIDFELHALLSDEEFDNTGQDSDELTVGGSLGWQLGRHIGLRLTLDHVDRGSSDPTGEFEENRAFLTVFYRSRERGEAAAP